MEPSKEKILQDVIREIRDRFGEGAIMKLGDARKVDVDVIPSGSLALDVALGVGGYPRGRIVEMFGSESSGKCIQKDSIIFSEYGMLPISSFGRLALPGFQRKKTFVYSEHSFAETSHFYNDGLKDTIRVQTRYGFTIEGTRQHRIRVLDKDGNYLFRRLDELCPDDYVAIQRGQNYFGKDADLGGFVYERAKNNTSTKKFYAPKTVTKDLAAVMGYLIGDGTTTKTGLNKNNIQITAGDPEAIRDFTTLCRRIFKETPRVTRDKRSKAERLMIHNGHARAFFVYAGVGWHDAATKEVPWSILCAPKSVVSSFLSSLFECDGGFSGGTIEYCTKSEKLAEQLHIILLNYGIVAKKKLRRVNDAPYYYLYIEGQRDKRIFASDIRFRSARKNSLLEADIRRPRRYASQTNVDSIPYLGQLLERFFDAFGQRVRRTNRADWNVVGDYLSRPRRKNCALSYPRLERIMRHFSLGRNLPEYQRLEELGALHLFFDRIKKSTQSKAHVVDFTIPKGATFFANGFINHNTTLALHATAEVQKRGGLAAFIDAEHALDPDYARRVGVKIEDLLLSQPDTGEQALDIVETLVRAGAVDLVVVDSVAALVPRAEIEGEMGQPHMALQARLMSQALRKLTAVVSKVNATVMFINQIRMRIGVFFGNPETTPGGTALKFYSSVRVELRRAAQIKKGDQVVGNRIKAKVVKNKVAAPFRTAEFDIMYNEGVSREADLLATGLKYEVITRSGLTYYLEKEKLGAGLEAVRQYLKEHVATAAEIQRLVWERAERPAGVEAELL